MSIQVTPKRAGRKRGGQPKHWAEEARVQAWYAEIKRRSDWSDYQLDYEFAWTEEGLESRSTAHRPRTFEWIRKKSRKPRGIDWRWRNMEELVVAVDENPFFHGTRSLYEAEIWDLLQDTSPTPEVVQERIDQLLQANDLVRLPIEKALKKGGNLIQGNRLPTLFDRCLRLSLAQMDRLSAIALIWSLYLMTEPVHNAPFREMVELIADRLLDQFFFDYFPDDRFSYYDEAIGTLLQTRLDLPGRATGGYGYIETIGTWPIVPKGLIGELTAAHLLL